MLAHGLPSISFLEGTFLRHPEQQKLPDSVPDFPDCESGDAKADTARSRPRTAVSTVPAAQSQCEVLEVSSGPHLRGIVVIVSIALWFAARTWIPQASMLPVLLLCTASTSALWCTQEEIVVSLGPIPVCLFRKKIPYRDIESVHILRGRLNAAARVLRRICMIQPFGFAYALTLGKDVVDIRLLQASNKESSAMMRFVEWMFCGVGVSSVLVSVDEAEDVVAHVLFRSENGPTGPLPASLVRAQPKDASKVQWVLCDFLDLLLSWHARNRVACDACSLLLQPFQEANHKYEWTARSRTA